MAEKANNGRVSSMVTINIGMCPLMERGNVTYAVVRSMLVVIHHQIYVQIVGIKDINTSIGHNKSDFSLQENHQLYHLCSHGRKVS